MKNIFFKISLDHLPTMQDFQKGVGFYWIEYNIPNQPTTIDDVWFWSGTFHILLNAVNLMSSDVLAYFEIDHEAVKVKVVEDEKLAISEEFFLKAMAMAKANSQSIKISDILK